MAAMPMRLIEVQSMGQDLAQRTVCVKVRLGRLGNTRKVSNSQVEVDTDKSLLLISKHLLDSKELRTIASFDGEIRRYLYDTCLPFEAGIHLCPLALLVFFFAGVSGFWEAGVRLGSFLGIAGMIIWMTAEWRESRR